MKDLPRPGLLERKGSIRFLWILLYSLCGLTLIPEFWVGREAHFGMDGWWGFYGGLGFVSCAVLILLSKVLGWFLKVREDYYDRD